MIQGKFEHELVEFLGRAPRHHQRREQIEALRDQLAGLAHALEAVRAMQPDLPGLARRRDGRVDIGHRVLPKSEKSSGFMPI